MRTRRTATLWILLCLLQNILPNIAARNSQTECKDSNSLCTAYIEDDGRKYCRTDSKFFYFMKETCPVTCGLCDCEDYKENCLDYKRYGYCTHPGQWAFMKLYCEKTCNLCETPTPEPTPLRIQPGPALGTCGLRVTAQGRIIGGERAIRGAWPWQAGLYRTDDAESFFCGGTLINPLWVLTAAHCFSKKTEPYRIRIGDYQRFYEDGTEQYFTSQKVIIHSKYHQPSLFNNDIALIKLNRPAMLNSHVNTACLPLHVNPENKTSMCFATGWGKVEIPGGSHHVLQQAKLPVVSNNECQENLRNTPSSFMNITKNMFCAGNIDTNNHSGSCYGDSGGPFVCLNAARKFEVDGVVSWGSLTCNFRQEKKQYTVFTRVRSYLNWIKDNVDGKV